MLNNEDFVQQSLTSNLFNLRTIAEYCINIQLSLYVNNQEYIDRAAALNERCDALGIRLVKSAEGHISADALEYQIFVTEYTLPLERLTEDLFDIKIATEITDIEALFRPGIIKDVTPELIRDLEEYNKEALVITNDFIELCEEFITKLTNNTLFSYSYPSLFAYMLHEAQIYKSDLERLIEKNAIDPIFAVNTEFLYNTAMRAIAAFLRGMIDPIRREEINKLDMYFEEFDALIKEYREKPLSPDNQMYMTQKSMELVDSFHAFMKTLIQSVLDAKIYFNVEPLFLDNMYTEINYFRYLLNKAKQKEQSFV